jgi:S-adenosylmethionine/arginine decarboxylase-like enzyme
MAKGYVNISFKDIRRALITIKLNDNKFPEISDILKFSNELVEKLNSYIITTCYAEFPSDLNGVKNYTVLSVLSTSHIAISTYFSKYERYIDLELSWCSGAELNEKTVKELAEKCFGSSDVVIKLFDAQGNFIK